MGGLLANPFGMGLGSDLGALGSWNQDTMIPVNPFNQAVLTEDDTSYQFKCHVPGVRCSSKHHMHRMPGARC